MKFDGGEVASIAVNVFIAITLFGVFFPMVNTAVGSIGLNAVDLFGTTYDFSWVGYLIILGMLFVLIKPVLKGLNLKTK